QQPQHQHHRRHYSLDSTASTGLQLLSSSYGPHQTPPNPHYHNYTPMARDRSHTTPRFHIPAGSPQASEDASTPRVMQFPPIDTPKGYSSEDHQGQVGSGSSPGGGDELHQEREGKNAGTRATSAPSAAVQIAPRTLFSMSNSAQDSNGGLNGKSLPNLG
ncbi:unnamed protein product, partial [Amoebophrya sp. A120]